MHGETQQTFGSDPSYRPEIDVTDLHLEIDGRSMAWHLGLVGVPAPSMSEQLRYEVAWRFRGSDYRSEAVVSQAVWFFRTIDAHGARSFDTGGMISSQPAVVSMIVAIPALEDGDLIDVTATSAHLEEADAMPMGLSGTWSDQAGNAARHIVGRACLRIPAARCSVATTRREVLRVPGSGDDPALQIDEVSIGIDSSTVLVAIDVEGLGDAPPASRYHSWEIDWTDVSSEFYALIYRSREAVGFFYGPGGPGGDLIEGVGRFHTEQGRIEMLMARDDLGLRSGDVLRDIVVRSAENVSASAVSIALPADEVHASEHVLGSCEA